jgi:hypothetical protein
MNLFEIFIYEINVKIKKLKNKLLNFKFFVYRNKMIFFKL